VSLRVYDVVGRLVRNLEQGARDRGEYRVLWNARNNQGERVGGGVYLYQLEAEGMRAVGHLVVLD
jgi:flagellar hook assembly protein FlgD